MLSGFVNAKQIQQLFRKSGTKMGYNRAREIKNELREKHKEVALPDQRVIPIEWLEEAYGEKAYKNKKKKDAS